MAKIQKLSDIQQEISFTEFDFYHRYEESFKSSELGRIKSLLPLGEMAISFGLVEENPKNLRTQRGRKPFFTPEGKVALAFLKMHTGPSAPKLMGALNGNIHYQIFCGIRICPESQLTNYKLIDNILLELSKKLKIQEQQKILADAWKPYMKNLDTVYTDASCYESLMRFPTDVKLLMECVERAHKMMCSISVRLGERRMRTKYNDIEKANLAYRKQRKHTHKQTRKMIMRLLSLLEKILCEIRRQMRVHPNEELLNDKHLDMLEIITRVYRQQKNHFNSGDSCESIPNRIVSVSKPYVFVEERNGTWNTPYLFNGKELDEETGLYYYGARYLNPTNGMWLSVDPLWEKNIDASPYSYCHGNPVKLIDPDGRDEYEVDGTGYVTKVLENKEKDVVYSVDKKGNRVNSIEFNQRIIEKSYSKKNSEGVDIHIIQMRGDDNATQLFEFLANPDNFGENREGKNVEWGLTMTGETGEKGLNFLTTSHNRRSEKGFPDLYHNRLRHGYTIRKFIHNHPGNTPYPSGLKYRDSDISVANTVSKYTKGNASFSIYVAKSNTYINYDGNSLPEDFGFMPSYKLDECVVTAHQKK